MGGASDIAELLARMARLESEIKRMTARLDRLEADRSRDRRQAAEAEYEVSSLIG